MSSSGSRSSPDVFSRRVPDDLAPNRLAQAVERLRIDRRSIIDLTESNPTRARFDYPADLLAPLADPRALTYPPEPFGSRIARSAVAAEYSRRGLAVAPEQIVLTASTSEAYSLLFKLLCDPADDVLVPRPSYPLFEHLTRLDAIVARRYDLEYHGLWSIDVGSIERRFSERTRAVLVVSPNNPTGSFLKPSELEAIAAICSERGAVIIADEVFADYELTPGASRAAGQVLARTDVLVFGLGGLSKSVGLPQAKLGWVAVAGPEPKVREALARLELVCDTYLSVSTPVQVAAAELLERGRSIRAQIQRRIAANHAFLIRRAAETPACRVLKADGGWYGVLQVPSLGSEEDLVLALLGQHHVLVHPGYFFDFSRGSFIIVSLLPPEPLFREGVARICRHFDHGPDRP